MRLFIHPKRIKIPVAIVSKAEKFAEQVISTVDYSDSNQQNIDKIRQDHFISKIGEEAACAVFRHYAHFVSQPDYHIYRRQQKSWDADIQVNGVEVAVKTQRKTQAQKYGLSWTFQAAPYRKDPILQQPDQWVCFVACDDLGVEPSYDCTVYPPQQIGELMFKDPILAHLKGKKLVVYADDLVQTH